MRRLTALDFPPPGMNPGGGRRAPHEPNRRVRTDSQGPRRVAIAAAVLVGIGFILASYATSPSVLYLFYGLGGIGVGVLYGISTASAV